MKKLSLAVAVAATLVSGVANAYTVAVPEDGVLVPNVIHNGDTDTTAVALINHNSADGNYEVYWTFFDEDSNHITDGQFTMTENDVHVFTWSANSGLGLDGVRGYLVFGLGTSAADDSALDDGQLSAAAFQADAVNGDAVYIPTFPLDAQGAPDGTIAAGSYTTGVGLSTLDGTSVVSVFGGAPAGDTVDMRYAMDAEWSSSIVLWATGNLDDTFTVNMYNDAQARKSVNFECDNTELCFVDPTSIAGRPAAFTQGYIRLDTPADLNEGAVGNGAFVSYSAVRSASFGATQTILNTHY